MNNQERNMVVEFSEMMTESGRAIDMYRKHLALIANLAIQTDDRLRAIEAKVGLKSPTQIVPKSVSELREELAKNAGTWSPEKMADQLKLIEEAMSFNPT